MAILIDLEATCWDKHEKIKQTHSEIIEISAIVTDEKLEVLEVFSEYIKPVLAQELSEFCINLTGITQQDINSAKSFTEVMKNFEKWLIKYKDNNSKVIAWGNYDQVLLRRNILMNKYFLNEVTKKVFNMRFYNLQTKFEELMYMSKGNCKLSEALFIIGEQFQGREHSSLFDVINMLKVYRFVSSFDKLKFIEENRIFVNHINQIRDKNLKELKEWQSRREKKRLEKEVKATP